MTRLDIQEERIHKSQGWAQDRNDHAHTSKKWEKLDRNVSNEEERRDDGLEEDLSIAVGDVGEDNEVFVPEEKLEDVSRHHAKDEHGDEASWSVGKQVDWAVDRIIEVIMEKMSSL